MVMSIIQYMSKYIKSILNPTKGNTMESNEQNFLGLSPDIIQCRECKKEYRQGALDFLVANYICPKCENRKENK